MGETKESLIQSVLSNTHLVDFVSFEKFLENGELNNHRIVVKALKEEGKIKIEEDDHPKDHENLVKIIQKGFE